jgi:hypothetical protein
MDQEQSSVNRPATFIIVVLPFIVVYATVRNASRLALLSFGCAHATLMDHRRRARQWFTKRRVVDGNDVFRK